MKLNFLFLFGNPRLGQTVAPSAGELIVKKELKKRERQAFQRKIKAGGGGNGGGSAEHNIFGDSLPQVCQMFFFEPVILDSVYKCATHHS